ncbi:MAG: hypothetical protein AVDCRST_MAG42-2738, partial [uncultured Chthoniobacterales bacterium]
VSGAAEQRCSREETSNAQRPALQFRSAQRVASRFGNAFL